MGAITCSRYWEYTTHLNTPPFYADLPGLLKDPQPNRSVNDIVNKIYYDDAHATVGSHGIKFQISFALNDDGIDSGWYTRVFLGNNNVNIINDTDLPTFW